MPSTLQSKYCTKCKVVKELSSFYPSKKYNLGVVSECNLCCRERASKWAKANPLRVRLSKKKWAKENRTKVYAYQRDWEHKNKDKKAVWSKRWYANNPEKARNRRLINSTGISLEQYEEMLKTQGGVCAICLHISQDGRNLCVDHCHKTGKVRGLLCSACNKAIGLFKDEVVRLKGAIKYLSV